MKKLYIAGIIIAILMLWLGFVTKTDYILSLIYLHLIYKEWKQN